MKGEQTIELTHASITEAIQEYLARHFVQQVRVIDVTSSKAQYGSGFTVEVRFEQPELVAAS